jgi:hypothetical protein
LFFIGREDKLTAVEITTEGGLRAGIAKPLFTIPVAKSGYEYDVTHDGRFLVNARAGQSSAEPNYASHQLDGLKTSGRSQVRRYEVGAASPQRARVIVD